MAIADEISFADVNTHTMRSITAIFLTFILIVVVPRAGHAQGPVCDNDSTGLIPLIDLGPGYYLGYQGGLFPGGANAENPASQHFKKGRSFARNMQPLDGLGQVNYHDGVVLMGGFGPSLAGKMWDEFVPIVRDTTDDYNTNRCFDAINMGAGGKGLDYAIGPDSNKYWNNMLNKIEDKGYTPAQLQVAWMYFNDKYDTTNALSFPETPLRIRDNLETYLRMLLDRFPNVQIMFVSGRHYGGYCDTTLEQSPAIGEPASYWNNFAVKWLIEDQINGATDLRYFGVNKRVPFVTWGPYYWTDGNNPRATDGRAYACSDFSDADGFHLKPATYAEDADYLMQHIYNSQFSRSYVRNGVKWVDCIPYNDSLYRTQPDMLEVQQLEPTVYPNPAVDLVHIYRAHIPGDVTAVEIFNIHGDRVAAEYTIGNSTGLVTTDIHQLTPGMYLLRLRMEDAQGNEQHYTQEFIKQ